MMKTRLFGLAVVLLCMWAFHMGRPTAGFRPAWATVAAPGGIWVHRWDNAVTVFEMDVPIVTMGMYATEDGAWSFACPVNQDCRISGSGWVFVEVPTNEQ